MPKKVKLLGDNDIGSWPVFIPTSTILVSCIGRNGKPNIIPIAGWGVLNRYPFTVGIAICQAKYPGNYAKRHSHDLVQESGEYVVNIPHSGMKKVIGICGSTSGEDTDKFEAAGVTPAKPSVINTPLIEECPVNLECKVTHIINLGSHDLFIGEVVAVHTDSDIANGDSKLLWESLPVLQRR